MQSHQVIDDFAQLVEADSTVFVQGPYRPLLALPRADDVHEMADGLTLRAQDKRGALLFPRL